MIEVFVSPEARDLVIVVASLVGVFFLAVLVVVNI